MLNWVKWCTSKGEYNFGVFSSTRFRMLSMVLKTLGARYIFKQDITI